MKIYKGKKALIHSIVEGILSFTKLMNHCSLKIEIRMEIRITILYQA